MPATTCDIEESNHLVVVHIATSKLEASAMQEVVDDLMERMRYTGAIHFILDVKPVEFISSACLGVMVQFLQDLEHVRGRMALARCQENVAFLFKVTRLDKVFHLYDDVEDAKLGIARG
ncbi:MAG: STAS domain-containing protein [Phycisphaeraceae bacterium]